MGAQIDYSAVSGRAARSKGLLLTVLLMVLVFNKVEHAALGVLLQSIKEDLQVSDTQLGLLSGIAFTLFYAALGIPIARWADQGNRVTILAVATALQCGALAVSGLAMSFAQLLLVRIGVAVGEAGCVPPSNSLIADCFPRGGRSRATSIYMLGYPLSALIGYFLAGWLNHLYGWRLTFTLLGVPGLLLAVLVYATLNDPRTLRARSYPLTSPNENGLVGSPVSMPSMRELCADLWRNVAYRNLVLGYSLLTFFGIGSILWMPTLFVRVYTLKTNVLGVWLALIWGVGGVVGSLAAGELTARLGVRKEGLQLKALAIAFVVSGVCAASIYISSSLPLSFALLTLIAVVNYGTAGPLFATIQTIVPERARASAVAITYLFTNLIGMGLGPLAVGVLSDLFRPAVGDASLRYALLILCPGYVWAAWHVWRAGSAVKQYLKESTP